MNRLSPLIVRRSEPIRRAWPRAGRRKWMVNGPAAAAARPRPDLFAVAEPSQWLENLKLFATGWIGGLIFFGTLFG